MDRGASWDTVHAGHKEWDTTEATELSREWGLDFGF